MQLIDAHTHAFAPGQVARRAELAGNDPTFAEMYGDPAAKMATLVEVAAALRGSGFAGAVVAGFAFARQVDIDEQNDHLLGEGEPGFAVLATVNPALPDWKQTATRALERGAVGFGELRPHNQGWDPCEGAGRELCEFASDAGAVMLWHVSEPVGHAYPGKTGGITPVELVNVAEEFPDLKQVAAHFGGGLPFYAQMREVRRTLTNVWFDTAAASLLYDDECTWRTVELVGPARVLFASDFPLLSPRRQLERILPTLPAEAAEAICGGNASMLYRISITNE